MKKKQIFSMMFVFVLLICWLGHIEESKAVEAVAASTKDAQFNVLWRYDDQPVEKDVEMAQFKSTLFEKGFYSSIIESDTNVLNSSELDTQTKLAVKKLCELNDLEYHNDGVAQLLSLILIYVIDILPLFRYISLVPYLMVLAIQLPLSVAICYCANKLFFRMFKPLKTLIICDSSEEVTALESIRFFDEHFDIDRVILYREQNIAQMLSAMDGYDAVFIGNVADDLRKKLLAEAVSHNIEGYVLPTISDVLVGGSEQIDLFGMLVIKIGRNHIRPEYFFFKRFFDIVMSFVGLIVFSPLMIVIAIAVKLCDGGSVFYKQTRLTQYGRPFQMLKFRSMCPNAEEKTGACLVSQNDSRITTIGRVIRPCRLDELPQLINILKGDMTFVGPRPERPEIAAEYEKALPEFRLRLQMKAGLTGLAQVCGKYSTDPEAKLKMDLIYANRMSFYEDIRLILATLKIIFMSEKAEGIEVEQSISESIREKEAG